MCWAGSQLSLSLHGFSSGTCLPDAEETGWGLPPTRRPPDLPVHVEKQKPLAHRAQGRVRQPLVTTQACALEGRFPTDYHGVPRSL